VHVALGALRCSAKVHQTFEAPLGVVDEHDVRYLATRLEVGAPEKKIFCLVGATRRKPAPAAGGRCQLLEHPADLDKSTMILGPNSGMTLKGENQPKPVDWAAAGAAGAAKDRQMGNTSAEEAMTAASRASEDGPEAPPATTHGPAAEMLYEGAECDVDMGNAAEASATTATAAARVRPPRPANWGTMTKPSNWGAMSGTQRKNWYRQGGKER